MDVGTEWRDDRNEAEAGTSAFAYNDDVHELFPEVSTPHLHHSFNSKFNVANQNLYVNL